METFGDGASIFLLPIGYAVFAFGLLTFALGQLFPTGLALSVSGILSLLVAFLKWNTIAMSIMDRWSAGNRAVIARHNSTAANLEWMADAFTGDKETPPAPIANSGEAGQRITVNTAHGSYSVPPLNEAEVTEHAEVGECLRFLRIGEKAGKFSLRAMHPYRPAGMNKVDFEKWWTARGDQLVAWELFAKEEKSATRPLLAITEVRSALLSRSFKRPLETVV